MAGIGSSFYPPSNEIKLREVREILATAEDIRRKDIPSSTPIMEGRFMLVRDRELVRVFVVEEVMTLDIREE